MLATDWSAPGTAALKRIDDSRALQFWDKSRLVSHALGEHDKKSIVWDRIAIYPRGALWNPVPSEPVYSGGPVLDVIEPARAGIAQALAMALK